MATTVKRDYRLTRIDEAAVALDDDQIEDRVEANWWRPDIPRDTLKTLMQRRDGPALMHFGLWIALLVVSGGAALLAWGTWWAIPAFLLYGTIYSSSDARWHECGHGTPFKTRWLNEVFYHLSSFMTLREGFLWRWSHARHHTHTYVVGLDPEIQVMRPADLLKIVMDFFYLRSGPPEVLRIVRHALGRLDAEVQSFVPEDERWKMIWSSRVYVAILGAVAVWSVAIGSVLPMLFVGLPRFYGGWLHQLLGLTQHAGLKEDVFDHRANTRTVYINPVFRYLYMNMNYHLEHHSTPMVPYHALPRLHEAIKDQTPPAYPNLWAVYKEMIPTLIKQATEDPDYHIVRPLPTPTPEPAAPAVEAVAPPQPPAAPSRTDAADITGSADVAQWIEVCPVSALAENDVTDFEFNGKRYAVYRLAGERFYASDGLCSHEQAPLAEGLVIDGCIECPRHNGRFDVTDGKAVRAPARKPLATYPAARRGDRVYICIPG